MPKASVASTSGTMEDLRPGFSTRFVARGLPHSLSLDVPSSHAYGSDSLHHMQMLGQISETSILITTPAWNSRLDFPSRVFHVWHEHGET